MNARDEIIRQIIILVSGVVAITVYAAVQRQAADPDFLPRLARRIGLTREPRRDTSGQAAARQVEKEISWLEHGRGKDAG